MTISSTARRAGPFFGNGVATDFAFDFKLFKTEELRVVRLLGASNAEVDLVMGVDYDAVLNADQDENPGGGVTLRAPLAYGDRLTLVSAVPELQPVDITNQGGFYPDLLNGGLDRATILVQQLKDESGRSIKLPVSSTQTGLTLPLPQGNQLLTWNGDGSALVNRDPGELISVVTYGNTKADFFDGDGATRNFTLTASPGSVNNMQIAINGVMQVPGQDYTWGGGKALSFVVAPPAGTKVFVRYQEALDEGTDVSGKLDRTGANADPTFLPTVGARAEADYPVIQDLLEPDTAVGADFDWAPYLARTDIGFITIPPGDFRVKTNCTVQRPVYFAPGSRLTIDAGVTVTFAGAGAVGVDTRRQVFYGAGGVAGLPFLDVMWFAGDKAYSLSANQMISDNIPTGDLGPDATADVQKAFSAVRLNGAIRLQDRCLTINGVSQITLTKNAAIRGNKQSSIFIISGTAANAFRTTHQNSSMSGFWVRRANLNVPATEGVMLDVKGGGSEYFDFYMNGAFTAISSVNSSGGTFRDFSIFNSREIGILCQNNNDPIIQNFFIVADDEFMTLTGLAGGFAPTPGTVLTGLTSGTKVILKRIGSGNYIVTKQYGVAAKPIIGETLSAATGGTAVLSAHVMQHRLGGSRFVQTADTPGPLTEAVMMDNGDIIGGVHSMVVEGFGTGLRQGPSYNRVSNVFLDSALDSALLMSNTDGWTFSGVCIQSRFDGLVAQNVRGTRFIGSDIRHCSAAGAVLSTGNTIDFAACQIADNRYGIPGNTGAHIYITNDPATKITFSGGVISRSAAVGGVAADYGISLNGTGGQLYLWGVRFGATGGPLKLGAVQNLASLTNYTVDGCSGLLMKRQLSFNILAGQSSSGAISHGLALLPVPEDFRITTSYAGGLGGLHASIANITATSFEVVLSDDAAVTQVAPRNLSVNVEIDKSYKA